MNLLDMRAVAFTYAVSNFICLIVMAVLWARYRRRFPGLGFWLADFALQFVALVLLVLRGALPEEISMLVGNPLAIGGTVLLYIGLERFTGKRGPQWQNIALLAAYTALQALFMYARLGLAARNILFSAALAAVCLQCIWLIFRRVDRVFRPISAGVGWVMAVFSLLSLARIVIDAVSPPGIDFFHSNIFETAVLLGYQVSFMVLTFALVLTVNRRLFAIMESDLTVKERTERIVRLRLKLWEYAAGHGVMELMQQALDEIEDLTGSLIGFYHFVEEEQGTLTLQAWSTRTRKDFCKAEGEGMHYAIAEAGVWVECLRVRRPVIHNDYASLPDKKGLPPGHATVVRELVVPTMREGRVVSVLGVGNKPTEYEESDIVLVSYIADLVWTIVTQRRSDEEILRLNGRLERLAMTDELTGLANRRAFFKRGAEELKRSRRYDHPLSLVMLDLDHFKNVNDSYGHDVGDRVLFCVAKTILANVRDIDLAARLGGEEFGLLLPNTEAADARSLAERLRQAVERTDCRAQFSGANVTISAGVSVLSAAVPDIDTLLKNADIALYQAKREGRNRVCFKE